MHRCGGRAVRQGPVWEHDGQGAGVGAWGVYRVRGRSVWRGEGAHCMSHAVPGAGRHIVSEAGNGHGRACDATVHGPDFPLPRPVTPSCRGLSLGPGCLGPLQPTTLSTFPSALPACVQCSINYINKTACGLVGWEVHELRGKNM